MPLSDYEHKRALNIERNNARLRALGLISIREEQKSNAAAWGRRTTADQHQKTGSSAKEVQVQKRKKIKLSESQPTRQSKRLRGQASDNDSLDVNSHQDRPTMTNPQSKSEEELDERIRECRKTRLEAANALAAETVGLSAAEAAKKNPTATYDHCLMRVRTMSERGLENRIKVIERAAGKYCVVKMAIFKCCLEEEGYVTLAEKASESLERLKALLPPPDD